MKNPQTLRATASPTPLGTDHRGRQPPARRIETSAIALLWLALGCSGCTGYITGTIESGDDESVDAGTIATDAPFATDAPTATADAANPPSMDAGAWCGNGQCDDGEGCAGCPQDCGACVPVCGDTFCNPEENPWDCSSDCGVPSIPADFAGVVWLHTDVSSWAQTANLDSVTVSSSTVCLDYDKASVWPGLDHVGAFVNANPWIFVYQDGTLYAATWEWMRYAQTCKNRSSVAGDHIKQDPLWGFAPQSGTYYGFMVSGLARDSVRNVYERSQVVLVQWP